ncbi:MAG: tagatose 1,6-diphosphate aldolase [Anaerolineales bacterium]|nr:tagatose 1,6-diphosphate aldolase [Anaerolineales bacterium]
MSLSIGKRRGLAQCSTRKHIFSILALDHRNNLRKAINPGEPEAVLDDQIVDIKKKIVRTLAPYCSAVLLDPEIGAAPTILGGDLPGDKGLVVALEATGYKGNPTGRVSRILPGWSVGKARRIGASAVKLLVYYHPDAPQARDQESLVLEVAEACQRYDLLYFIEPLSYSLDPHRKKLPSSERRQVVVETARRLTSLGVDVLKAEFPLDVHEVENEVEWKQACCELTETLRVPWVLLSAGVDYDTYLRQVAVACQSGASGIMAGRAVWKEVTDHPESRQNAFLEGLAAERMRRLNDLCEALAKPWTVFYPLQEATMGWYKEYADI